MRLQHPFEIITPTLDGEVLSVLAGADEWFAVTTINRMIPQRSDEGIRNTLKRLVSVGIADELAAGRAFLYRLNREHIGAPAILHLAGLKNLFYSRLTETFHAWKIQPIFAAVFGSAARNQMSVDSDIDLFLVRPDFSSETTWDAQVTKLVEDATRWTGSDLRPLLYTESEVRRLGLSEPVFEFISTDGIPLVGDHTLFQGLLRNTP